jgi:predicted small metal-binding protein
MAVSAYVSDRRPLPGANRMEAAMKRILCGELVPGCAFQARAETQPEVLHVWAGHVRAAHGLNVSQAFLDRARAAVEDVPPPGDSPPSAA